MRFFIVFKLRFIFKTQYYHFTCKVASTGQIVGDGVAANIRVNLTPRVEVNQNLVVDLSQQILL